LIDNTGLVLRVAVGIYVKLPTGKPGHNPGAIPVANEGVTAVIETDTNVSTVVPAQIVGIIVIASLNATPIVASRNDDFDNVAIP
tara:strand:- start:3133 stop:3387 length:255 start_codon:yes stop_codon:yes gene_type:complete